MPEEISYGEFGRRFVAQVVTPERVREAVGAAASGPIRASVAQARGLVVARAEGHIVDIEVEQLERSVLAFVATLVVDLGLTVRVARMDHRYAGAVRIPLQLGVTTRDDLAITIDIADVHPGDIDVRLRPEGARAKVIHDLGGLSIQVAQQVAAEVNERKDGTGAMADRFIEIAPTIEEEWERRQNR